MKTWFALAAALVLAAPATAAAPPPVQPAPPARPLPIIDMHMHARAPGPIPAEAVVTEGQKRDILYNSAARFLRLTEAERTRHGGM